MAIFIFLKLNLLKLKDNFIFCNCSFAENKETSYIITLHIKAYIFTLLHNSTIYVKYFYFWKNAKSTKIYINFFEFFLYTIIIIFSNWKKALLFFSQYFKHHLIKNLYIYSINIITEISFLLIIILCKLTIMKIWKKYMLNRNAWNNINTR